MPDILILEIQNRLVNEKKCIEVYHYITGITDTISFNHSITLPLQTFAPDQNPDFLQINLENEAGYLNGDCRVDLPSWVSFDFFSNDCLGLTVSHLVNRTLLRISPGPPTWKLKISRPGDSIIQTNDNVIIRD